MDGYSVIAMLYTSVQTALLACVRYWLYRDTLRVPHKRMYAALFALSLGSTGLWIAFGGIHGMTFSSFRICLAVAMFLLSCYIIKAPFTKHSYTYSFIMVYDSALELTASYMQQLRTPGERDVVFSIAAAVLLVATFIPVCRYLKRMIDRLSMLENDRMWSWLCVISYSFVFMNLLFTYPPHTPTVRDLLSRYLMLLGIAGLYAATFRGIQTLYEAAQAKAELDSTKKRIALQQGYYDRILVQMEEVRRFRHDQRHHRTALAALVKSGDLAALSRYFDDIPLDENTVPVTGNLTADSVLLYYLDIARSLRVDVKTSLVIGRETPVSDPDLCILLGNLLENAIEAQQRLAPERRYIRITGEGDATHFTLAVDNRFDGTLLQKSDAYLSRKKGEGHGLGIGSVRAVAGKYGGLLQISVDGDMFMAGVVIGL